MKLLAALFAALAIAAAAITSSARRKLARREACAAWLALQPQPADTSVVVYTDRVTWVDPRIANTQWRGHDDLTMDHVLSDAVALGPCEGVIVCAGERDLRDGVPIADVIGDLARLHDHLSADHTGLEVIAIPRPCGRWGPAVDNLNNELDRLCTQRDIPLIALDDDTNLASLLDRSTSEDH